MGTEQLKEFYVRNSEIFVNNELPIWVLREIGWFLFRGLVWIADKCQALYDTSFGLIDFTSWSNVNEYVGALKPLFIALTAISLFALGVMLIFAHEKKPKIVINICLAVLCVTCSTVVFHDLNQVTKDIKKGFESISVGDDKFDGVYDIVGDNLIDLIYLDKKVGIANLNYEKDEKKLPHPDINKENFWQIDYGEVLNYKSERKWNDEEKVKEILKQKLVIEFSDAAGDITNYQIRDVYNGFGWNSADDADLANEYYYRYHFSFFLAVLQIVSIIVLYVALSYKCVRIAFELVVARLLAFLYAAELSGGEKLRKILIFIRDSYILLLVTTLCIRVFYLFNAFITTTIDNTFVQGVLILFVAFSVIDGPNLVEKILGMDAGLSQSTARLMAAYGTVKAAGRAAMAPVKMAQEHKYRSDMKGAMTGAAGSNLKQGEGGDGSNGSGKGGAAGTGSGTSDEQQQKNMDYMDGQDRKNNMDPNEDRVKEEGSAKVYSGGERNEDFMNRGQAGGEESFMDQDRGIQGSSASSRIDSEGKDFMEQPQGGSHGEQSSGLGTTAKSKRSSSQDFMERPKKEKKPNTFKKRNSSYQSDILKPKKDKEES